MSLPPEVAAWIERQCGGRIVGVERQVRWRPHDFATVERAGGAVEVVVRHARATTPDSPSYTDIGREARVLEALQGRGVKIPGFLGFHPEHGVLLMERVAGTSDFSQASDDGVRQRLMGEYFEQLARLHSLDVASMRLEGVEAPATPEDVALGGMYGFHERDYLERRPSLGPDPLLDLGMWWVRARLPQGDRPLRLLQGDTGPGQFMFEGDRITALIDWELAQIGDPMRDLAVVRIRNMLYPTGSLRGPFVRYEEASGRPIDRPALSFYTVMLALGFAMGLAPTMQRPSARIPDMVQRFGWSASFRRGLCDALAESLSLDPEPPELLSAPAGEDGGLAGFLVEHLELNCLPTAQDPAARSSIEAAVAIARTEQLRSQVGARLEADDLDDMAAVLGRRPRDRAQGLEQLARLVQDGPQARLAELVSLFSRIERRREHLLRPMMVSQASEPLERLGP